MLKIIIENATFTCHEAGQVIDVALVKAEEWLHEGSIICPSCTVGNLTFFTILFILFWATPNVTREVVRYENFVVTILVKIK